jgi:hypothetical protein
MTLRIGHEPVSWIIAAGQDIETVEHCLAPGGLPRGRRAQSEDYPIAGATSRGRAVESARCVGDHPALRSCPIRARKAMKDRFRPGGSSCCRRGEFEHRPAPTRATLIHRAVEGASRIEAQGARGQSSIGTVSETVQNRLGPGRRSWERWGELKYRAAADNSPPVILAGPCTAVVRRAVKGAGAVCCQARARTLAIRAPAKRYSTVSVQVVCPGPGGVSLNTVPHPATD